MSYGAKKVHQHPPCNELHCSLLTAVTIVIVHEKLSLTCSLSSFHAANPIHNQFFSNIFSLEIYFIMLAPDVCTMAILYIHIYYTYIILNLNLLPVLFMDSRIVSLKLLSLLYKYSNCHCIHYL